MSAYDVLNGLIAALPEANRPIFNHIGQMLAAITNEFTSHVQDNVSDIQRVETSVTALAGRLSAGESALAAGQQSVVDLSAKLNRRDAIENSPSIVAIKADIANMKKALDHEATNLKTNVLPAMEKRLEEKVYSFGSAMVAHVDSNYMPLNQEQSKVIEDISSKLARAEELYRSVVNR